MAATAFNAFWDGPDKDSFSLNHLKRSYLSCFPLCEYTETVPSDHFDVNGRWQAWSVTEHLDCHGSYVALEERDVLDQNIITPVPSILPLHHSAALPAQIYSPARALVRLSHRANSVDIPVISPVITESMVSLTDPILAESNTSSTCGDKRRYRSHKGHYDKLRLEGYRVCRTPECLVCHRALPECLRVSQPSWAAILRVVFYALKMNNPLQEFFNLRSHVYDFVDAHWNRICIGKIKSDHWHKQLQDTLAHNKKLFTSGAGVFKQKGFWRLECHTDPWEEKLSTGVHSVNYSDGAEALTIVNVGQLVEEHEDTCHLRKPRASKRAKIVQ